MSASTRQYWIGRSIELLEFTTQQCSSWLQS